MKVTDTVGVLAPIQHMFEQIFVVRGTLWYTLYHKCERDNYISAYRKVYSYIREGLII